MKMNSRQLEKYWAALEELLSEVLLTPQNGTGRQGPAPGTWPQPSCVNILGVHLSTVCG